MLKIPDTSMPQACIPIEEVNLRMLFQRHNMDLALWRRSLVLALKFDLANKEEIYNRLIKEPQDTAEFFATHFGQENADRYTEIVRQRIEEYRSMVEALIAGDIMDAENHFRQLIVLVDQLADFFYELSPVYTREEWVTLLRRYEELMYNQAYAVATENYAGEVELFDRIIDQIILMTEHFVRIVAVALGWSSAETMASPDVRVTTAIWRFPGH